MGHPFLKSPIFECRHICRPARPAACNSVLAKLLSHIIPAPFMTEMSPKKSMTNLSLLVPKGCSIVAGHSPVRARSPGSNSGAAMLPHLVRMSLLKHDAESRLQHYPHHLPLLTQFQTPHDDDEAAMRAEHQELVEKLADATRGHEQAAAAAKEADTRFKEQLQASEDKAAKLQEALSQAFASMDSQRHASAESFKVEALLLIMVVARAAA